MILQAVIIACGLTLLSSVVECGGVTRSATAFFSSAQPVIPGWNFSNTGVTYTGVPQIFYDTASCSGYGCPALTSGMQLYRGQQMLAARCSNATIGFKFPEGETVNQFGVAPYAVATGGQFTYDGVVWDLPNGTYAGTSCQPAGFQPDWNLLDQAAYSTPVIVSNELTLGYCLSCIAKATLPPAIYKTAGGNYVIVGDCRYKTERINIDGLVAVFENTYCVVDGTFYLDSGDAGCTTRCNPIGDSLTGCNPECRLYLFGYTWSIIRRDEGVSSPICKPVSNETGMLTNSYPWSDNIASMQLVWELGDPGSDTVARFTILGDWAINMSTVNMRALGSSVCWALFEGGISPDPWEVIPRWTDGELCLGDYINTTELLSLAEYVPWNEASYPTWFALHQEQGLGRKLVNVRCFNTDE